MQTAYDIANWQIRALYGYAKQNGLNNEQLHDVVYAMTKCESIKQLSYYDAKRVITALKGSAGQLPPQPQNRASEGQQKKILAMAYSMGWMEDKARLRGWLEKRYHVSDVKFLTEKDANDCIEGMKSMQAGGRGGRRPGRGMDR